MRSHLERALRLVAGGTDRPENYVRVVRLYLLSLGFVYLAAFFSFAMQWRPLIASDGIAPARQLLDWLTLELGPKRLFVIPTLAWINSSDLALAILIWGGVALSVLLILGIGPRWVSALLWIFFLSLLPVGNVFLEYQWESLLCEAGFLAPFLSPAGWLPQWPLPVLSRLRKPPSPASPVFLWLHRWLLFRLLFSSGMSKWMSGDPTWRSLTALRYHYETQPLPTPIAWYASHLPLSIHRASTLGVFIAEIAVPFFFFLPRPFRLIAFWVEVTLQCLILLTGNYGYFNWLTLALCLFLLDDRALGGPVPVEKGRKRSAVVSWIGVVIFVVGAVTTFWHAEKAPPGLGWLTRAASRLRIVSSYALFSVMTTERDEIVIEGSPDQRTWLEYEFPWKPGDVRRAPPFVAPHQPRADWQAWFAALSQFDREEWLQALLFKMLRGDKEVTTLFARDPFPDRPPRYLRVLRYRYRFSTWSERRSEGVWWKRDLLGDYSPVLSLKRAE